MLVDFCKHYFLISVLASEMLKCVLTKIQSYYVSLQNSGVPVELLTLKLRNPLPIFGVPGIAGL